MVCLTACHMLTQSSSVCSYERIIADAPSTTHRPASELLTRSKLSCLAWSAGEASHLISSDYEGLITLWDAASGNPVSEYEAHERRIWSIDFCGPSPDLFASGSDDGCVRVRTHTTLIAMLLVSLVSVLYFTELQAAVMFEP